MNRVHFVGGPLDGEGYVHPLSNAAHLNVEGSTEGYYVMNPYERTRTFEPIFYWKLIINDMPIEYTQLRDAPVPVIKCPKCRFPFEPFLRGMIQRNCRSWFGFGPRRDYCALICTHCKEIIGYESPPEL